MVLNIQRIVVVVLMVTMFFLFPGCTTINSHKQAINPVWQREVVNVSKSGFPIVDKPVTLKVMVKSGDLYSDYNDIAELNEYEKKSGIHIQWIHIPAANVIERSSVALATRDLPDVFLKCSISDRDLQAFGEQGVFLRLNDFIANYGRNINLLMERNPDVRRDLTLYDGSIYSLPELSKPFYDDISLKLYLNQRWMKKLELTMPKTLEEFYSVLKAFKENDPNGNGRRDEIPFTSSNLSNIIEVLKGAWGLGNRGGTQQNFDFDTNTGTIRFIKGTAQYGQMLDYLRKLYQEELLDREILATDTIQLKAKANADNVGAFVETASVHAGRYVSDYTGVTEALQGPNGDKLWAPMNALIRSRGQFVITSTNPFPEATIRWMDYWYEEGKTGIFNLGEFSLDPLSVIAAENMRPFLPQVVWPAFNFSSRENERLILLEQDILRYTDKMAKQYITDMEHGLLWERYAGRVKEMDMEEYIGIYQDAYRRYQLQNQK